MSALDRIQDKYREKIRDGYQPDWTGFIALLNALSVNQKKALLKAVKERNGNNAVAIVASQIDSHAEAQALKKRQQIEQNWPTEVIQELDKVL